MYIFILSRYNSPKRYRQIREREKWQLNDVDIARCMVGFYPVSYTIATSVLYVTVN